MQGFLNLLQISLVSALLIMAIAALRTVFKNVVDRRVFILLWAMVIFSMLALPFIAVNNVSFVAPQNQPVQAQFAKTTEVLPLQSGFTPTEQAADVAVAGQAQKQSETIQDNAWVTVTEKQVFWFFMIWLVGTTAMLTTILLAYLFFHFEGKKAMPLTWLKCPQELNSVKVFLNDRISSPVTVGFLKYQVHLPFNFDLADERLIEHVLVHESVHIDRHDNLLKFVALLALCVHWFNPLAWMLVRMLNKDIEFSCDTAVLKRLGMQRKAEYANTLLVMAQASRQMNLASMVYVSFGGSFLKERVLSIMKTKSSLVLSLILAVVFSFGIFSAFAATPQNNLTFDKAREIALGQVGAGSVVKSELDYSNGLLVYEIDIVDEGKHYEVKISAVDGSVLKYSQKPNLVGLSANMNHDFIGEERAMQIAVDKVGAGTIIILEEDFEHGVTVYDITVLDGNNKYEIDIDARSGDVVQYKQKNVNTSVASSSNQITAQQAQDIALGQVGAGTVVKCKLDYDDKRAEYEVTIINANTKYEIDIDAATGRVIKQEQKPVTYAKINKTNDMISAERAVQIAMDNVGSGILVKCKLDYDKKLGIPVYEVEIVSGKVKYEYDINANNGSIVEYEVDNDYSR